MLRIQPIVDKDEFSVSLRFIPKAVFRAGPWSLKGNLFPTGAIQAVAGAEAAPSVAFPSFSPSATPK